MRLRISRFSERNVSLSKSNRKESSPKFITMPKGVRRVFDNVTEGFLHAVEFLFTLLADFVRLLAGALGFSLRLL